MKEIWEDASYAGLLDGLDGHAVVVDVGANIGLFSLFALDRLPDARIIAVEGVPDLCDILEGNLEQAGRTHVVRSLAGAVSGEVEFDYYPRYTMMSGQSKDRERDRELVRAYTRNSIGVVAEEYVEQLELLLDETLESVRLRLPKRTLASILEELGVRRVDALKVDVEGAELEVLEGLGQELGSTLTRVTVEVDDRDRRLADIERTLLQWGLIPEIRELPGYGGTGLCMVTAGR